jgi:hypothetical protein
MLSEKHLLLLGQTEAHRHAEFDSGAWRSLAWSSMAQSSAARKGRRCMEQEHARSGMDGGSDEMQRSGGGGGRSTQRARWAAAMTQRTGEDGGSGA